MDHIGDLASQHAELAKQTTAGMFETEEISLSEFDSIVEASGLFTVYKEVEGFYVGSRPNLPEKRPRVDRILVPRPPVMKAGWRHGPLAIEAKKSGSKLGRIISQSLDYSHAVFEIMPGFHIWCEWLFVWPLDSPKGDVESIMAQNRIGWCSPKRLAKGELIFGCGGMNALTVNRHGDINCRELPQGRKQGSR